MKLQSAHVLAVSSILASALVFACAESAEEIPGEEKSNAAGGNGTSTESSSTLPPSNPAGGSTTSSSGGSTSSGGQSTSSGSTTSSSGSTTSSSGGSSGGAPACAWAGDFQKMLSKMTEIQAGAPCDSTCNPATHCCLDLLGGMGASGGTSGGLPLDAGTSSGGGGLPTGGGGTCVSNN